MKQSNSVDVSGSAEVVWNYPSIGYGDDGPPDTLRVCIMRVQAISDLILSFDGHRGGWVISGSFPKADNSDIEIREVAFIEEWDNDKPFDSTKPLHPAE